MIQSISNSQERYLTIEEDNLHGNNTSRHIKNKRRNIALSPMNCTMNQASSIIKTYRDSLN